MANDSAQLNFLWNSASLIAAVHQRERDSSRLKAVDLQKDELWRILVDTVHALPMYKNHKRYVQDIMLREKPDISSKELAVQLNITLGEAIIMLEELRGGKEPTAPSSAASPPKRVDRTLLDFDR